MVCTTKYVGANTISISKTFVLPDRNSTFTGLRDPRNFNYFLLNEIVIYKNGTQEFITHHLTEQQVNQLFYTLDSNNWSGCMRPDIYNQPRSSWN